MPRPKLYRDPIHGQIRYLRVDGLASSPVAGGSRSVESDLSYLITQLIDSPEFQRLRHIRQNGLVNLVFHGAEHSRFGHSMGTCALSQVMYERIARNMSEPIEPRRYVATVAAALLHDVGHGPFSHVFEEILSGCGVAFHHEVMTCRMMLEADSPLHRTLSRTDAALPAEVALYIDRQRRVDSKAPDHFSYRLVSSQIDADRLDYLQRDAYYAGLEGHGFDVERLLDMLLHLDHTRIAVYRRAIEPVEGYLLALDQMYRTVYYHHTARAASVLLGAVLRRALELYRSGDTAILPSGPSGRPHPLRALFEHGQAVPLAEYQRLTEHQIFALIEDWQAYADPVLSDLSRRLMGRALFKTIDVDPRRYNVLKRLQRRAEELVQKRLSHVDRKTVSYYVAVDEPERLSYKRYDWRNQSPDDSIWIVDDGEGSSATAGRAAPVPIEKEPSSIIAALASVKYFHRLVVPAEVRDELLADKSV